ncbi:MULTISPECIES: Cof-type HAD-IIB family hydrolase [Turicibacter]|jgi:cof-like hydrolase|uniref:Cof-type HAD-IIB family hydrolase n=2 Tax=Turicibacter sanguinis TaxID=154288 RepID=A0A9X5ANJ6_9FIRM|nr:MULTISPECIES: HAD family hydrolase [Turicibacter]EFF64539.1 Cof-like hydrolase [Turicibacter sanguinis PC909]MBP3904934.1 Cof-type HAD-IIB family hydrolase [Turicibacter sp.]MCU7190472.1 Cof-type HAD-IIB family hydrolase [Turicibacter sanguinis]MCU7212539.1 Cof-type HAD-IIB family hydrolase [Turicibacter sanguinis]MDB8437071.1 HAD family hydrolase [Turicibacter sanguinis]
MNKSIFFDVDNTLVCREKNMISKSTIQAIKSLKKKNINIAIATGRSLAMVKQESFYDMFKTIISANGSLITVNDEVIYKEYMNQRLVRDLLTVFEKNQTPYCIHFLHESKGKLNQAWVAEFSIKYNMPLGYLEEDILNQIEKYEVFQINAYIKDSEIEMMRQSYPQFSFVKLIDIEDGYDIFNKHCSKGSAIRYLKSHQSGKEMEYYAFGDGFNDLEMFAEVDYSIAMGNGCDLLKERATYVTDSIHENGIYNALKNLKLI